MKTAETNPGTRIGRLALNDVMLEGRGLLVAAASITGVALLLWGVLPTSIDAKTFSSFLFPAVLLLGGFIYTSGSLSALHQRDRAIDYLMLPATLTEKLISRILQSTVLYTIATVVLCVLISVLVSLVRLIFGREGVDPFNPFTRQVLQLVVAYLVLHAAFLCGSASFHTGAFVKTVLVAMGFGLLTALYLSLLGRIVIGNINVFDFAVWRETSKADWERWLAVMKITAAILWYSSAPFFWGVTHLRMREIEA